MDADVREAFDDLKKVMLGGFTTLGRRLESLENRVGALEAESKNTVVLFGQMGESLAAIHEQLGRNNARLERLTSMFMDSKTEAIVRYGRIEQRLVAVEERLGDVEERLGEVEERLPRA